ncbi:MAG: tRNA lysidine(34) synthetase TilS [Lachnospiraceae bacterium]|nr:tRNA lysidine(34) synthetase TilS [Lachnospiraceae bacterium]
MINEIFQTIRDYHMIEPDMRVIAGVSGGADSVCLLDVLRRYQEETPFSLLVVHVEHGLRGQESLDDAAFVKALCEKWKLPCRVVSAKVRDRAAAEGLSCEEAGRAERYRIFERLSEEWKAERIAVAHNQNDQAETVLWNLSRGSGLRGLGGIRPVQGKLIRPLLFTSRADIEAYLREVGLVWRTDRTNLELEYTRNRIRLSLLPQMERDLNAQAGRHIAEAAGRLREVQEYLDQMTDEAAARCIETASWQDISKQDKLSARSIPEISESEKTSKKSIIKQDGTRTSQAFLPGCESQAGTLVTLRISSYKKEAPLIQRELLRRALRLCGGLKDVGAAHLAQLDALAGMDCGKSLNLPGKIRAVREDGILRFEKKCSSDAAEDRSVAGTPRKASDIGVANNYSAEGGLPDIRLTVPGSTMYGSWRVKTELTENRPELKKYFLKEKKYTKWISYDTIEDSLQLRTRKQGDYLVIDARGGRKKLKDYFIDQKIPRYMRDRILLLADGSHILWVVGWRLSEAAKVTADTRRVLKVQVTGIEEDERVR